MGDYSVQDIANAAYKAGFRGASLITAVAISLAEDGEQTLTATNHNTNGSVDRGPWQINNKAHPDVSDQCAFDLQCSADSAFKISSQGNNFGPWTTFTSGAYKQFLQSAQGVAGNAANAITGAAAGAIGADLTPIGDAISAFSTDVTRGLQIAAGMSLMLTGLGLAAVMLIAKAL